MQRLVFAFSAIWLAAPALAQAVKSPFGVGAERGGGGADWITGWILAQQNHFYLLLKTSVHAAASDSAAAWTLAGLSFAYGVFHAAGPGHGKAVVASYMLANEQALRRGLVISLLAALLQGIVAIALVAVAALVFHATAQRMNQAATLIEQASYAGILALGLWLVWSKGWAFLRLFAAPAASAPHAHGHHARDHDHGHGHVGEPHVHDEHCGHFHAPDPRTLGAGFSWRAAIATVAVAGSRPCSGAILVLVFTLAQGIFAIGVWATLAMSLGTAVTTGGLAAMAVLAKSLALRFTAAEGGASRRIVAGLEAAAAVLVALLGASLLAGSLLGGGEI